MTERPPIVGGYRLVQDYDAQEASIRVFRVFAEGDVESHIHQHSKQFYVALDGKAIITVDGVETSIRPFEVLPVPVGSLHSARSADDEALLLNISVPRLRPDDQVSVSPEVFRADLNLPAGDRNVDMED